MESIGEKLRATREEKSLSIDQVARDTNIAKRYLVALEEEAFSEFPGEPYLIGFLRNYADYLGLDAEEIVGLYKNFKIQEQPVPMEELLEPKRSGRNPLIFVVVVAVIAIVAAAVVFLPPLFSKRAGGGGASSAVSVASGSGTEYQLKDEIIERRFVAGDTVVVPVGDKSYKVKLSVSGRDLVLNDSNGTQTVKLGEEKAVDLNGDGTPDLKVFLRDIDTQDPAKGIIVRFDRFTQSPNTTAAPQSAPVAAQQAPPAGVQQAPPAATAPAAAAVVNAQPAAQAAVAAVPPAPQAAAPQTQAAPTAASPAAPAQAAAVPQITPQATAPASGPVVIANNPTSDPFAVNVTFSGYCLFRYLIDGQSEDQRYFQKGETTRLEVKQDVEIWASNGGALSVSVAGNTVDLGNPGEVVARKIAWVKNPDSNGYRLEMTRLQ
jgi:cytoskeletal protein RodZ